MASLPRPTIPTSLRRLVPAALLAAAATLGGSAFVDPATACAAPNTGGAEWDVAAYDACMRNLILSPDFGNRSTRADRQKCCTDSGGQWNDAQGSCQSPPAEPAEAQPTLPGVAPRPGVATQPPPPPPPPIRNPEVTMPFQPGPVSPG
jgi:hypothetical protein